jgi:hypothetical protein
MDPALQRLGLPFLRRGQWPKEGEEWVGAVGDLFRHAAHPLRSAFMLGVALGELERLPKKGQLALEELADRLPGDPLYGQYGAGEAVAQVDSAKRRVGECLEEGRSCAEKLGLPAELVRRLAAAHTSWVSSVEDGRQADHEVPKVWNVDTFFAVGREDVAEEISQIITMAISALRQTGTAVPGKKKLTDRVTPWIRSCMRGKRWGIVEWGQVSYSVMGFLKSFFAGSKEKESVRMQSDKEDLKKCEVCGKLTQPFSPGTTNVGQMLKGGRKCDACARFSCSMCAFHAATTGGKGGFTCPSCGKLWPT